MPDDRHIAAHILVVDDEEANVDLLEQMLARAGYTNVTSTTDPRRVLPLLRERGPDLILLDLLMPHLDGYAVLEQLRPAIGADAYLPVLVLTADITPAAKQRALSLGANDFLTKPFDQIELLLRIRNLLETRFLHLRLRQQNALLERLYEETRAALRVRDESLSAITHDLGQPLTSIRVAAQLLQRQAAGGDATEAARLAAGLAGIDAATGTMWSMLDELLDVVRLDAGRPLDLNWQQLDLVALARREAEAQAGTSARHRLRVETEMPELIVEADPARIGRALANLIANAIKFSPEGGDVRVTVTREPQAGGDGAWAVVRVQDRGVGIPAADLPHVFERFYRGTNVAGRITGTGIGLATARQIVEQHGGRIDVASDEGRGSTFSVRLPLQGEAP
jgi:signal transduction histidine kinase